MVYNNLSIRNSYTLITYLTPTDRQLLDSNVYEMIEKECNIFEIMEEIEEFIDARF